MMALGIDDESRVLARGPSGMIVLRVVPSDEQVRGEVFVPMGPYANHLISAETHGSGMPDFKSTVVDIEPSDQEILPVGKVMEMSGGRQYAG
jgi:formylmethanofuran dehydrogenase subunit D